MSEIGSETADFANEKLKSRFFFKNPEIQRLNAEKVQAFSVF